MRAVLIGNRYSTRIDRRTGREVVGKLEATIEYVVEVEGETEREVRQAAIRCAAQDWPGYCFSVTRIEG